MFGYNLVIIKIWSDNILLPKASSLLSVDNNGRYTFAMPTNKHNNYCYRLKPSFIKKEKHPKNKQIKNICQ